MFKCVVKSEEMRAEMKRLREAGKVWGTVLQAFGAFMLGSIAENFRAQGRPEAWKPLQPATILARWMRGNRSRKNRRSEFGKGFQKFFGSAKILQDKGRLAGSIGFAVKRNQVEIGTNLIYAATHQFGDKRRNIPERPYLLFQDDDVERFEEIICEWLEGKG